MAVRCELFQHLLLLSDKAGELLVGEGPPWPSVSNLSSASTKSRKSALEASMMEEDAAGRFVLAGVFGSE